MQDCSTAGCNNPAVGHGKNWRKCRSCLNEYQRNWQRQNKARRTIVRFKITEGEYVEQLEDQYGRCANPSCLTHWRDTAFKRLVWDNERRKLLCVPCNKARGLLQDDPLRLRGLADYVEGTQTANPMSLSKVLGEPISIDRPAG